MRCMVYNLEDPDVKEFYLCHNGVNVQGKIGVEIDLKPQYINVLNDAVIDTEYMDMETNTKKHITKPRFKVMELGAASISEDPSVEEETKKGRGRPRKEETVEP